MKPIFSRTLETTLKKVSIIMVILVGIICGYFIRVNYARNLAAAFTPLLNDITAFQHILVFLGMNGMILAILTVSAGTGLIATEVHEGTFKLLSAKPNTRQCILISKLLGAFLGLMILMALQLLSYFAYVALFSGLDHNIIAGLTSYLPGYLLYGSVIIVIFLAISTFLSTLAKKKVAALLPLLAIIIAIFGVIPFYRIFNYLTTYRGGGLPILFDVNYQLATIFETCIGYNGVVPKNEFIAFLTNLYKYTAMDKDVIREGYSSRVFMKNTDLKGSIMLLYYAIVAIGLTASSFAILKKKDI